MRIEDLQLAEDGMGEHHAYRGFANEPIASEDVQGRSCKRIRMGSCTHNRKAGEKRETRPKSPPRKSVLGCFRVFHKFEARVPTEKLCIREPPRHLSLDDFEVGIHP